MAGGGAGNGDCLGRCHGGGDPSGGGRFQLGGQLRLIAGQSGQRIGRPVPPDLGRVAVIVALGMGHQSVGVDPQKHRPAGLADAGRTCRGGLHQIGRMLRRAVGCGDAERGEARIDVAGQRLRCGVLCA